MDGARWDDARVFLGAYRLRSLSAAALRLGLDISTVSRRLTAFEEAVGARLFERGRHGLAPTRAAEGVLAAAEAMEVAHARLTREATAIEATAEGIVRVSAPPGMADTFVVPALVVLRQRYPGIVVELETSVRVVDLGRHEADLGIRSVRPTSAELVLAKLRRARSIAYASPAFARSLGVLRSWDDAPWVTYDQDLASLPTAKWIARHVDKRSVVLRTSHFASHVAAAAQGLAVALLPEPYTEVRELVPVRHDAALAASAESWPVDDLWLVGHRATREIPRIAAVWSVLVEAFRVRESPRARLRPRA